MTPTAGQHTGLPIQEQQTELLYKGMPFSLVASVINAAILAYVQWNSINANTVKLWLLIMLAALGFRTFIAFQYKRSDDQESTKGWRQLFFVGVLLTALCWGGAGIFLFPPHDISHQAFLAFVFAGMAAGAVTTLASDKLIIISFLCILLIPLIGSFFFYSSSELGYAMGTMVALFLIMIIFTSIRINQKIVNNIRLTQEAISREKALAESQELLKETNKLAMVAGWQLNLETGDMQWSEGAYRIHEVSPDEEVNLQKSMSMMFEDSQELFKSALYTLARNHQPFDIEIKIRLKSGLPRWLRVIAKPEIENDVLVSVKGVYQDISVNKKADALKDDFIATISHELRTPLTSIKGALSLLESGVIQDLAEDTKKMLELASRNSDRLLALINDLLDMEKIASGKLQVNLKTFHLSELLTRALHEAQPLADQYQVKFELHPFEDVINVMVDEARFVQVIVNLLSNAAKFSDGEHRVDIRVESQQGQVRINITDYGRGVPENFRDMIFQKFSQADVSNNRTRGGMGLGLSISKLLIEKMGGTIGFESETGKGSTFYVQLARSAVKNIS